MPPRVATPSTTIQPDGEPCRTRRRRFWSERRGVVALEFAVTAIPLVTLLLGIMEISYDLFVQSALDNAVATAARSVQTGNAQGSAGETSAQFITNSVCPQLGGLLSCSNLIVGVAPIPTGQDFYTAANPVTFANATSAGGSICTGSGGQLMMLQAWYVGMTVLGNLIPGFATTYNGGLVHLTTASAGFVNEYFTGGQTTGVGC